MNLQDTFYLTGIIFMSLLILLFISVIILLFIIKKKLNELYEKIEEKYEEARNLATHPKKFAKKIGATVAKKALAKAEKMIEARS